MARPAVIKAKQQPQKKQQDTNLEKILNVGKEAVVEVLEELSRKGGIARKALISLPTTFPTHDAFMVKLTELDEDNLATVLRELSFLNQTKTYLFWKKI